MCKPKIERARSAGPLGRQAEGTGAANPHAKRLMVEAARRLKYIVIARNPKRPSNALK